VRTTHTLNVGDRTHVELDVPSGSIEVRESRSGIVVVNIDADNAEEWEVLQLGDSVSVRYGQKRGWKSRSARIFVEAPANTNVDINSASADSNLVGHLGEVRIRSASGDLRADTVQRLDVSTASGDIKVGTVTGRLNANSASGDVRADTVADDLSAGTASGDVRIGRCDGSDINVKSVSGDIHIGLPTGIRVEPDISSLSGSTRLPAPSKQPHDGPRRAVRLRLRTVSGDITIERITSLAS
jgi:DUF4097 and DUF4098 domain-containing protein YvlB